MIKISSVPAVGKFLSGPFASLLHQHHQINVLEMRIKFGAFVLLLIMSVAAMAAPPAEEGKTIFSTRCAGCHSVHKVLTGPALAGVDQRRTLEWIISFVQSSQTMIKKGDKDAVALFEKFGKIPMPDHADLTDDNIKSIVAYIKTEAEAPAAAATNKDAGTPARPKVDYLGFSSGNYGLVFTYAFLLVLLTGSLVFLAQVKALRRKLGKA